MATMSASGGVLNEGLRACGYLFFGGDEETQEEVDRVVDEDPELNREIENAEQELREIAESGRPDLERFYTARDVSTV
jgi:hypothetical protein